MTLKEIERKKLDTANRIQTLNKNILAFKNNLQVAGDELQRTLGQMDIINEWEELLTPENKSKKEQSTEN